MTLTRPTLNEHCHLFATVAMSLVSQLNSAIWVSIGKGSYMKTSVCIVALVGLTLSPPIASARDQVEQRPDVFQKLIDCRKITDATARLACFDAQVANLDDAESRSEVVIVDKAQVKKAKRSLFGLTLPNLRILGDKEADKGIAASKDDDVIETTVKSSYVNNVGKLTITIDDGAKWVQIDTREVRTPKAGQPVRIRKAALGSFFANINGQTAIRMRREN
jgi:hypothetical protein